MTEPMAPLVPPPINVASNFGELSQVRRLCREALQACWSDQATLETAISRLQLAANETVANVICHGGLESHHPITCIPVHEAGQLHIDVVHDGSGFDGPESVAELAQPQVGGMGLFLIERCVDEVVYGTTLEGRQRIRLSLNIPEKETDNGKHH